MSLPTSVRFVEVGPRDGLQNEKVAVPLSAKLALIEDLADAGLKSIECGSFVSARWVPQMADNAKLLEQVHRRSGVRYTALVPNMTGFENAVKSRADEIAVFVSASESFSEANINCSIDESLRRLEEVTQAAVAANIPFRGYVSCVLGCPFEGAVPLESVTRVASVLRQLGCYEISLGDTIGTGTPRKAQSMLESVAHVVPLERLAVHYHDTWGQALANVFASLQVGISTIDCSVAGLGGCPYAPGAAGNVATEDVVYMLNGMEIETGVDLRRIAAAGRKILSVLGRNSTSKAALALQVPGK